MTKTFVNTDCLLTQHRVFTQSMRDYTCACVSWVIIHQQSMELMFTDVCSLVDVSLCDVTTTIPDIANCYLYNLTDGNLNTCVDVPVAGMYSNILRLPVSECCYSS